MSDSTHERGRWIRGFAVERGAGEVEPRVLLLEPLPHQPLIFLLRARGVERRVSLEETLPGFAPAEFLQLQMELAIFQRPEALFRLDRSVSRCARYGGLPLMPMDLVRGLDARRPALRRAHAGGTATYTFTSSRV